MNPSWLEEGDRVNYSRVTSCLALSRAVYAKDDQSCLTILNRQLRNMFHGIEHLQLAKESKVPYLIAYKPHTDEFYIAFRGTENLQTFLPSLVCAGIPNDFQGRVHAGYAQQAKLIPLSPFTGLLNSNSTCKLIFTGHSLGGAIAAMVTSNMLFYEQSIGHHKRISCVAFGAPFFTDEKCASYLNERFQDQFHFYINHSDPIPFAFCFVHDCLRRLSTSEQMQKCLNWLKTLLGIQQAVLAEEDQSMVNSLISNAPVSQLHEAKTMFRSATYLLQPVFSILKSVASEYQLFGQCYHIKTENPTVPAPNSTATGVNLETTSIITSQFVIVRLQNVNLHIKWLKMTAESIMDDVTRFYQDHGIRKYISELHTHIIVKLDLGSNIESPAAQLMSDQTPLFQGLPLAHFFPTNDPSRWLHNISSDNNPFKIDIHYWSVVSTDYPKDKQSNLSFQFHGPTVCFFLQLQYCEQNGITDSSQHSWHDAIRQPTCDEYSLSFEIEKVPTSTKRNMLYRCVHHFGYMDLSKIIDPSKFTSSIGLTGRKQQVANFKLVELYLASFSYVMFTRPSTEERTSAQTTNQNSTSDQRRREKIKKALLDCEELILIDRETVEKNLLHSKEEAADLFKTEVDKIRQLGARFAGSDIPSGNNGENQPIKETSEYHLYSLTSQLDLLTSKSKPIHTISTVIPTLVGMGLTIMDNLAVEGRGHSSRIATGAGVGLGTIAVYVIRLLNGPMMLALVVGLLLSVAVGIGVYKSLLTVIDQEYFKVLELIAKSIGVVTHRTRQHPYWLERAISEIYWNSMAKYSETYICSNWKTTFFQHHDLAKIADKQMQRSWINMVKCVHAHFTLRQEMSDMLTVGVIGVGQVGKSMLIHKMFGFSTGSGPDRTKKIESYRVSDHFQLLDLPHVTSTYDDLKRSFAHSYTMMNGIIVVLDAQQQGDDERGEGYALRTVEQLSMEGVDVLYCFNKSDMLVRAFDEGDKSTSSILSDDEDDDMSDLSSAKQITQQKSAVWNRGTTKTKIDEFANRYKQYGVQRDQCKLTFFELNESVKTERRKTKNHLKSVDILNGADIRNGWLRSFLEDNGFKNENIDQVMEFRYKNVSANK